MSELFDRVDENSNLVKKKCDGESRQKIERKLSIIQNVIDLDDIDCTFSETEMILDRYPMSEIEEQMKMWRYLSRLAIYLHNDYDFFSQLIVKINFPCPMFNNTMKNLGYVKKGNAWFQEEKPELSVIINTIFNYCFYCSLFKSMQTEDTEKCKTVFCSLCESEISLSSEVCPICYTVNKHNKIRITEQNKIEPMQKNDIKNVERHFEYPEVKPELNIKEDKIETKSSVYYSKKSWICEECTFRNEELSNNCVLCFTTRNLPNNNARLSDEKTSNIINNVTSESTVDSAEAPVPRKVDENYWICPKCTYKNRNPDSKCFVCNFHNKNYFLVQFNRLTDFFKYSSDKKNSESDQVSLDDSVVNKRSEEDIEIDTGKKGLARANSIGDGTGLKLQETLKNMCDKTGYTSKLFNSIWKQ